MDDAEQDRFFDIAACCLSLPRGLLKLEVEGLVLREGTRPKGAGVVEFIVLQAEYEAAIEGLPSSSRFMSLPLTS